MSAGRPDPWGDSGERLAAILESTDDAILAKDARGRITDWNAAAERMYGYSREEAIGRPVAMIIPPARAGEEMWLLGRAMRGETVAGYETERVRKDGSIVSVELTVSPVRDRQTERIVGASTIARDAASRVAQARLAALVDQSFDAIIGV